MMITWTDVRILLERHKWTLMILPLLAAIAVYIFLKSKEDSYSSSSVLYTGIASSYKIEGDNNAGDRQLKTDMALADMLIIIKSRETKKEIALSLLAQHLMLNTYNPAVLSNENFDRLQKLLPATLRQKFRSATFEETLAKLNAYNDASTTNEIYRLIHSEDPVYSFAALDNINVYQLHESEMFQTEYQNNDPAVTQQTLNFLNSIFLAKHQSLYAPQTASVINYFDSSASNAYNRLQLAEQALADFNKKHGIVDYDQQVTASTQGSQLSDEQYKNLQVQYSGARATLGAASSALKKKGVSNLESQEILNLRNQLSDVTTQIANVEMMGSNTDADAKKKLAGLKQSASSLTAQIKQKVDAYYRNAHSAQGVPVDGLVEDYVRNTMTAAQLNSQLAVAARQRAAASGEAKRLVPLEPQIRQIKREIDVAQQDYLAKLEGLKQSKLTQENLNLAANQVKVLDPPNFPLKPANKAKTPILVFLALFGTFLFTGSAIGTQYFLSNTLKSPATAAQLSGLPVTGILPVAAQGAENSRLLKQAIHQLGRQVLLQYNLHTPSSGPFLVGVASHFDGEGKSEVLQMLHHFLQSAGLKTVACLPAGHQPVSNLTDTAVRYQPADAFKSESFRLLVADVMKDAEIVLVEFPPMMEADYPVALVQNVHMLLLSARSGRTWKEADTQIIKGFKRLSDAPMGLVITQAPELYVAEHAGVEVNGFSFGKFWQRNRPVRKKQSRSQLITG